MANEAEKTTAQTVIVSGVEITGNIRSAGNIQFDGILKGDIDAAGSASFGKIADITGNIKAEKVEIAGIVNGNVEAKDRIDIKGTAKIKGDIRSKRLAVEDGVTFVGKVEVNPAGFAAAPATPAAPAAAPAPGAAVK